VVAWERQPHDPGDEADCEGHRSRRVHAPIVMHESQPPRDRLLCKRVGHRATGKASRRELEHATPAATIRSEGEPSASLGKWVHPTFAGRCLLRTFSERAD
jgi:hypothetical protein